MEGAEKTFCVTHGDGVCTYQVRKKTLPDGLIIILNRHWNKTPVRNDPYESQNVQATHYVRDD